MASEPGVAGLDVIRFLFAYQSWANERLFAAAEKCDVNRWPKAIAGGHGDGSLFATLAHLVGAEEHWLARWQGNPRSLLRGGADFGHLHEIVACWRDVQERRRDWLDSLDEATLGRELYFIRTNGVEDGQPLWQTLLHVSNHTTHHRAEACVALTLHGSPPQSVDLIDFIRAGTKD